MPGAKRWVLRRTDLQPDRIAAKRPHGAKATVLQGIPPAEAGWVGKNIARGDCLLRSLCAHPAQPGNETSNPHSKISNQDLLSVFARSFVRAALDKSDV